MFVTVVWILLFIAVSYAVAVIALLISNWREDRLRQREAKGRTSHSGDQDDR